MALAKIFHELSDPVTPVTIGTTFADNMIEMGDSVDVLSYHDYTTTRAASRANIAKAKSYAAKVGKPLLNTEIGCIARANPYDVTLQEFQNARMWAGTFGSSCSPDHGGPCTESSIPTARCAILRLWRRFAGIFSAIAGRMSSKMFPTARTI